MEQTPLTADLTAAEVMERWPETIPIFFRYRMACVGCPIAPFETLADVAAIYGLDRECLVNELRQTVQTQPER